MSDHRDETWTHETNLDEDDGGWGLEWQAVTKRLERIAVPGGWLCRTTYPENGGVALCFVPLPRG